MLGFAGVVIGDGRTGDKIDPLVMCVVSGGMGGEGGGKAGWASFTASGAELSQKASSMDKVMEEAILGLFGRTDSASATLDFQDF